MTEIDVFISVVGPRDGLQSIDTIMSTEHKKEWIKAEAESGVREIEVGSFVPAKLLPQMADAFEICLLYTSPSPRDGLLSRMPSSA